MTTRTTHRLAWSLVLLSACVVAACDEDRAPPVVATQDPNAASPNGPEGRTQNAGPNPISGHRQSALGKAYDVAENLRDKKIPEYNKKLEEEADKVTPKPR